MCRTLSEKMDGMWRVEVVVRDGGEDYRYIVAEEPSEEALEPVVARLETHFEHERIAVVSPRA